MGGIKTAAISDARKAIETPFMNDFWALRKAMGEPEDRQEYWSELMNSANSLAEKYNRDPYIVVMLLGCIEDLEKRCPGSERKGDMALKFLNDQRAKQGLPKVGVVA